MSDRIGTTTFLKRCGGISTTLSRKLERLRVIRPQRTDSGWRSYSGQDVAAARRWIAEHGGKVRK